MVVCSGHVTLAADRLPPKIVGNWCLAFERMSPLKTYAYVRCKGDNWDIIVRENGFDANETSCDHIKIERKGSVWLVSFSCSGAGLKWLEHDEIIVGKDGWTLSATFKSTRRVGIPVRYYPAGDAFGI